MEERQTNYSIMEGHELPSKGKIYDVAVNPHVELRSMTARDEMKRLAPSTTNFKTMSDLIEGCMLEKPKVHVYDMALGDYEFLLHKLRIVTYGTSYKVDVYCPHCQKAFETVANLDQLQVKEFDQAAWEEARTITLPTSGDVVQLNFQTPRMLDDIENRTKELKRKYKDMAVDFGLLVQLETAIDTVNNLKLDSLALEDFINKLPAKDMRKILNSVTKLNELVGIDTKLIVDCPHCGGEVSTFFRYGPEFFGPTTD